MRRRRRSPESWGQYLERKLSLPTQPNPFTFTRSTHANAPSQPGPCERDALHSRAARASTRHVACACLRATQKRLGFRVVPGRVLTGGPCVVGMPSSLPHPPLHHHRNTCSSLSYCVVPLAILLHFHPFSLRPSPPPSIPLSSLFLQDIMSDAEKKAKGEVSPGRRFGKGGDKRRGS